VAARGEALQRGADRGVLVLVAGAAGAVILSRFSVRSSTQQQAADQSALYARVIAIGSLVPLLGAFVVLLRGNPSARRSLRPLPEPASLRVGRLAPLRRGPRVLGRRKRGSLTPTRSRSIKRI
jgi:hypothetical protein